MIRLSISSTVISPVCQALKMAIAELQGVEVRHTGEIKAKAAEEREEMQSALKEVREALPVPAPAEDKAVPNPLVCAAKPLTEETPYGIVPLRPITNLPPGAKVRIRLRKGCMGQAFVKHEGTITQWLLWRDGNGGWMLKWRSGLNTTLTDGKEGEPNV